MEINPEMFVIPDKESYILYAPLYGSVLEVSEPVVKELQNFSLGKESNLAKNVKKALKEKGFIGKKFPNPEKLRKTPPQKYEPTAVTIMPTWDCNLRCRYCYSHGGENPGEPLDIEIAKSSIDFIIENSVKKNSEGISVSYHGGGEPLLNKNMPWIKEVTEYAKTKTKENNKKIRVGSATNGMLSKKNLEWIVNNLNSITLSWDGHKEVQNLQRPGINGKGSYDTVLKSAKYFENKNFSYAIRTTISSYNVNKMEDIVKHFINETSVKTFHLEPLFESGRGKDDKYLKAPSDDEFIENFIKAKRIANINNKRIFYSGSELEKIGRKFCGAAGSNFFITPDGNVTTCLEVSRPEDDMNALFIIGKYDQNKGEFEFNQDKMNNLKKRVVGNMQGCEDCFAKYNCSGDCLSKSYSLSGNLYKTNNNSRCKINRALLLDEIHQKLKGGKIKNDI